MSKQKKIRRFFDDGKLNPDVILSIMQEEKRERIKLTLGEDKLKSIFQDIPESRLKLEILGSL